MSTVPSLVINISTFVAVSVEVVLVTLILFHDFVVRYVKSASVIFVTASYYIAPFEGSYQIFLSVIYQSTYIIVSHQPIRRLEFDNGWNYCLISEV